MNNMPEMNNDTACSGKAGNLIDTRTAGGCQTAPLPGIDKSLLDACIHCGLCLPSCPTYLATGRETESPRGRIYLLDLWASGREPASADLFKHIDTCLGCLGCQTACPSGVKYEQILDQARPHVAALKSGRKRRLMRFAFSRILPDYKRLRSLGALIRLWQLVGGQKLFVQTRWLQKLAGRLGRWQSFLPRVPAFKPLPRQSWISGEKGETVQLFSGCIMDIFYNHVNHACVELLANQRKIVCVSEQTCCGALAFHAGEVDIACDLAKRNIELFEATVGPVVATAAGCGAMLKGYAHLLGGEGQWASRAKQFSDRVVDITESLASGQFKGKGQVGKRKVAYHAACHLLHAQKVADAPARLLSSVSGVETVPLVEQENCCGSAGIYNLLHTDLSMEVLARKVSFLKDTGADVVVTTNPGCLLQLETGLASAGCNMQVKHLVELLAEAYL